MDIAVIGTGNVGGALAETWAKKGHRIYLGVRDTKNFKGAHLLTYENITAHLIPEAVAVSEAVLLAAAPQFTQNLVEAMGDLKGKLIIDAMNSFRARPEGFANSFDALKTLAKGAEVVKCFNTTGYENMKDPLYNGIGIDMFVAGDSKKGKETAKQLADDCGFGECWDFGGDDKAALLEQLAFCWINLAIMQGHGRNLAFKILKR